MSVSGLTTAVAQPESSATQNRRIPSLDGLRAVSILLVMSAHLWHSFPCHVALDQVSPILVNGHVGVDIFFVISGYLITHRLLAELSSTGTIRFKQFYIRRAFRIWPAFYAFMIAIILLVAGGVIQLTWGAVAVAATFLWNYQFLFIRDAGPDHGDCAHIWSLSIEEHFYLFWPAVLLLLKPKRAAYLAMALILLSPVVRVGSYLLIPAIRTYITLMTHTRVDTLMFGCLAAILANSPRYAPTLRIKRSLAGLAAFYIFLIHPFLERRLWGMYMLPVGYTLEGLCISIFLLWAVRAEGLVGKLLNAKPLVHIGVISYSLYLWQQLFANAETSALGRFPLNLIGCFIVAEISYRVIERPFLRFRERVQP